ncbi:hypothetical protein AAZX31_15G179900 [Glycine max]
MCTSFPLPASCTSKILHIHHRCLCVFRQSHSFCWRPTRRGMCRHQCQRRCRGRAFSQRQTHSRRWCQRDTRTDPCRTLCLSSILPRTCTRQTRGTCRSCVGRCRRGFRCRCRRWPGGLLPPCRETHAAPFAANNRRRHHEQLFFSLLSLLWISQQWIYVRENEALYLPRKEILYYYLITKY